MTPFACNRIRSAEQLPIHHYTPARTRAHYHTENHRRTSCRAISGFRQGKTVSVIVKPDRAGKQRLEILVHRAAIEPDRVGILDEAGSCIDGPWHADTDAATLTGLCFERLNDGDEPACVEVCPEEAIVFGKRRDLLDEARSRIYTDPDNYVHTIYGEHEAGGTGWIYLASVPFDQLGFNTNLEMRAYPELAKGFLYSVAVVFLLWPPFLLGLSRATGGAEKAERE